MENVNNDSLRMSVKTDLCTHVHDDADCYPVQMSICRCGVADWCAYAFLCSCSYDEHVQLLLPYTVNEQTTSVSVIRWASFFIRGFGAPPLRLVRLQQAAAYPPVASTDVLLVSTTDVVIVESLKNQPAE